MQSRWKEIIIENAHSSLDTAVRFSVESYMFTSTAVASSSPCKVHGHQNIEAGNLSCPIFAPKDPQKHPR